MGFSSYDSSNLFSVKSKTCIVTGGGSGLGKGFATALAVNGAKVIICGRRQEQIDAAAKEIITLAEQSGKGGECIAIQADVGNKQGVIEFYEKAEKVIDRLDFLVNNAGFSTNWKDQSPMKDSATLAAKLFSIDDDDWANMTAVHCAGPYYLAVKFIPLFEKSKDASVVNITSLASIFLNRAVCEFSYAQSKAAEAHLTQLMAAALQPFKIRVNSIVPGLFPSGLTCDSTGEFVAVMEDAKKNIPKGRHGTWEEIAGPLLMMASPAGSYLNGANLLIDGGWNLNSSAKDV